MKVDLRTEALQSGDRRSPQAMQDQGDIIPLKHRSTSAAYLQARLRRDAPEVAVALERGEIGNGRRAKK